MSSGDTNSDPSDPELIHPVDQPLRMQRKLVGFQIKERESIKMVGLR